MTQILENPHVALNNARNRSREGGTRAPSRVDNGNIARGAADPPRPIKICHHSHTFHYVDADDFMAQMDTLLTKLRNARMTPFAEVRARYPQLSDTAFCNRLNRFKGEYPREMSTNGRRTVKLFVTPELHAHLSKKTGSGLL